MPDKSNPGVLRRAFVDICRGYSTSIHQDVTIYIRHLGHQDHLFLDDLSKTYLDEARSKGAPTEEERLKYIIDKQLWNDAREREITIQKDTILRFEDGKKQEVRPSIIRNYDKQIGEEKAKLDKILMEKAEKIGPTAEHYAQQRINDYYIINNLFLNKELTQHLFTESDFEDFPDSTVQEIVESYNKAVEPCNGSYLRHLVVQDFFVDYYILCADNLYMFFGKPIANLTFYQIRLGNAARYFKSLLEHTDMSKLPPETRHDPDAIERLFTVQKNNVAMQAENKVPVAMSKEDQKSLGVESQMSPLPKTNMGFHDYLQHMIKNRK